MLSQTSIFHSATIIRQHGCKRSKRCGSPGRVSNLAISRERGNCRRAPRKWLPITYKCSRMSALSGPPNWACQRVRRIQGETYTLGCVDEGRKRVLLIAASILAARKLAQYDGGKRVPATISAIADAVRWAEEIMREIDSRWPAPR
jgi:hypothetical protein